MRFYPDGSLAGLTFQDASTGGTNSVRTSISKPNATRLNLFSLLICGRAKSPQVVIDLTLSDDEDVSYVQPRGPTHTTSLVVEIPQTRHGLPMFTTSADRK